MNGAATERHAVDDEPPSVSEDRWARFNALMKADAQGGAATRTAGPLPRKRTGDDRQPKRLARAGAYIANVALGSLAAALVCGVGATLMLA